MYRLEKKFEGKNILVTGACGGVGPKVTDRLHEKGANVIGTYHSKRSLEEARDWANYDEEVHYIQVDLTDPTEVKALRDEVEENHGTVHGIVNLVGGFSMGSLIKTDLQHLTSSFHRHVSTVFLVLKYFADHLEENNGSVVNFSSQRAIKANPRSLAYNIGKTSVNTLTKTVNAAFDNARVNAVAPDVMDTPANRKAMPDSDRSKWTSLERVADIVEFLLSKNSETIRGQIIHI